MKISYNWLKDYIDLKGISIEEVIDKLTISGLEVEEVVDQSKKFENIVVGLVKEVKKHPNADKLSMCIVNNGKEDLAVVCGAPNVTAGQKVPFAKVGAVIPMNGITLSQVKIRGVISNGMICAEDELGLGTDHTGIMVLDKELKVGIPLAKALGMDDILLEVAITPNRSEALSHIGIARDLSAIFDRQLKIPSIKVKETKPSSKDLAKVEIKDVEGCPRYVGKIIRGVDIIESPEWLKKKIKSIGLRPINNVVDVTNFVLYEVGQPLHAFDLNFLEGKKIIVRKAGNDEKFFTLDSKERELDKDDLMICDSKKPVALAGIMGGENSEVKPETKDILIESAFFNPSRIRKTAKRLGLSTDASYRFERGTDYEIVKWAAIRAAQLIQGTAGGTLAEGEIDCYPKKIKRKKVSLRYSRVDKILGYQIPKQTIKKILQKLGFEIISAQANVITVTIPSYRHDIDREIDLIEEVARIYGYDKIPDVSKVNVTLEEKVDQSALDDKIRGLLNSLGFFEIITNSFLNENAAQKFGNPINILNPQNSEMSYLRPSLVPGMLTTISNNLKVNEKDLKLFEIGKVFDKKCEGSIKSFTDFTETENLLLSLTGSIVRNEWFQKDRAYDVYDIKGLALSFLEKLLPGLKCEAKNINASDSICIEQFDIKIDDRIVGYCGKIKSEICHLFDVGHEVLMILFIIEELKKVELPQKSFNELLKYPKIFRDCAFVVDYNVDVDKIIEVIRETGSNLLHNVMLFDIFQSESLGQGKKSLAFQLEFFDFKRTLTEEEVEKDFRKVIKVIETKFNAHLRGS